MDESYFILQLIVHSSCYNQYFLCQVSGKPPKEEFQVDGLTPNKKYKFRVKAVNKEGESEPLENDEPILARNPYGKKKIITSKLNLKQYIFFNIHVKQL